MLIILILNIFQPSSLLSCFCTWLVTSLDSCISTDLKLELNSALDHHIWSQQQVESLLEEAVSTGHVTTLARGFSLFLPVSKQNIITVFCSIQMTERLYGSVSSLSICRHAAGREPTC